MSIIHDNYFGFDAPCNDITNLDNDIELVAVLNHKGRAIETKAREEGLDKTLTVQKREMFSCSVCFMVHCPPSPKGYFAI